MGSENVMEKKLINRGTGNGRGYGYLFFGIIM